MGEKQGVVWFGAVRSGAQRTDMVSTGLARVKVEGEKLDWYGKCRVLELLDDPANHKDYAAIDLDFLGNLPFASATWTSKRPKP